MDLDSQASPSGETRRERRRRGTPSGAGESPPPPAAAARGGWAARSGWGDEGQRGRGGIARGSAARPPGLAAAPQRQWRAARDAPQRRHPSCGPARLRQWGSKSTSGSCAGSGGPQRAPTPPMQRRGTACRARHASKWRRARRMPRRPTRRLPVLPPMQRAAAAGRGGGGRGGGARRCWGVVGGAAPGRPGCHLNQAAPGRWHRGAAGPALTHRRALARGEAAPAPAAAAAAVSVQPRGLCSPAAILFPPLLPPPCFPPAPGQPRFPRGA